MPIEIRELVIRATVEGPQPVEQAGGEGREQEQQDLIAQCVEQVLEALRRSRER